jgi:type II secretory ATPase GspE/PulE/Tfp pilus assembly ATPase PilB-like protein
MAEILPLVDAASALLERAVELRASDLHADPSPDGVRVRLRVDGRFVPVAALASDAGQRLISRLKVMAGLMVYRCDIAQEGRIELPDGREARLAIIPTPSGEKATVRIFDPTTALSSIDDLGFEVSVADWLRRQLTRDHGLLLVVGPAGSGKTTTLYAAVAETLAKRGEFCHLATIEDPVERRLPGCTQVQVDPSRDLDFASGLKFLLRQDPEVVLVGEIRDRETATVAVRAAMTGHLVLSSLHCGRAVEARPRLIEMGAEPWAVDLALAGVLAQRLLRRCCAKCAGQGCEHCLRTGYWGRIAVAEPLEPGQALPASDLAASAAALVAAGVTNAAESERVLGGAK